MKALLVFYNTGHYESYEDALENYAVYRTPLKTHFNTYNEFASHVMFAIQVGTTAIEMMDSSMPFDCAIVCEKFVIDKIRNMEEALFLHKYVEQVVLNAEHIVLNN